MLSALGSYTTMLLCHTASAIHYSHFNVSYIHYSQFNGSPLRSHVTSASGSASALHLIDIVSPSVQFRLTGLCPSMNRGASVKTCRHTLVRGPVHNGHDKPRKHAIDSSLVSSS